MSGIYDLVLEIARSQTEFLMEAVHGGYLIADFGKQKASRWFSAKMEDGKLVLNWYLSLTVPLMRRREFLELLTAIKDSVPQGTIEMGLQIGRLRHRLIVRISDMENIDAKRFWRQAQGIAAGICNLLEGILNGPPLSPEGMALLIPAVRALDGNVESPPELAKCA